MSSTRFFQKAFLAGANDFILKPVNQYELLLRVQLNIKLALEEIEIKNQYDLLIQQKQEITEHRDKILQFQCDLIDDLNYASFIQKAILPDDALLKELSSSYFVYNKPKNIVSGDFYWISKQDELYVFALGDCTGHGISGALLTMAGTAFLNDIVNNYRNTDADKILNDLRDRVIKLMHQKGVIGEASNGMDIALCVYNPATGQLQYAGANNPIYLVRSGGNFEIIKADRMPIGYYTSYDMPFTLKNIEIKKGDTLYLFSDGYADQFGGPNGQKFRYHQFQELLFDCSFRPLSQQYNLIKDTMDMWMNGCEQVDDMLIIGLKF
jgi:serine phosphatase RsbU (regulator of sigma subunit)